MDKLRNRASRALLWDLAGNYGGQISAFVISIFLARLLNPEDFGLIGMSLIIIGILEVFSDLGFSSALIQNKSNSSLTYSSVFYLNIFVGLLLGVCIFLAAPYIAGFFQKEEIRELVEFLSISFLINSGNIVQSTILKKKLNFKVLTFRNLTAQIIAGMVAILFAVYGFGIYALLIQKLLASIIATVLLWSAAEWKPKLEFSFTELKKLSAFSFYVFAAGSVNKVIEQLDSIIIGKLFSPAILGFFYRANSFNKLIIQNSSASISNIFFPALTEVEDDVERFERIFLKITNVVSSLAVFLTAAFFLIGDELIIGLFGAKWKDSVPIFQILILKGFTFPISAIVINSFLAKGKSKANFHYGNARKALQLIPFIFAYTNGFEAFLIANVIVAYLIWILNMLSASFHLDIPISKQLKEIAPNLFAAFIISYGILYALPSEYNYFWALVKVMMFTVFFFAFLRLSKAPLLEEGNLLISTVKKWIKR